MTGASILHLHGWLDASQASTSTAVTNPCQMVQWSPIQCQRCGLSVHIVWMRKGMAVGCSTSHKFIPPTIVGRQHTSTASSWLGDDGVHWGHELSRLSIRCKKLLQQPCCAIKLAHSSWARNKTWLVFWERLHRHGGHAAHSCLAVKTLTIVLLGLLVDRSQTWGTVGGVTRAGLHERRGRGLVGSWPRPYCGPHRLVLRWEQVEVIQKVLHHILRATVTQRTSHFRQAGESGGHFGTWPRAWVDHVDIRVANFIINKGRETAAQRAGIGAGAGTESRPGVKVIIAVGVRTAWPLAILRAWAICAPLGTTLKSQL